MLYIHRLVAFTFSILLLYIVFTGAGIQIADMQALVRHVPETDPNMLMMRQHIDGPPNYSVVSAPDYSAASLPSLLDIDSNLRHLASLGTAAAPGESIRLLELRMVGTTLAGHAQMGQKHLIFDLASGRALPSSALPPDPPSNQMSSTRSDFKFYHRFNYLGQPATGLNALAGIAFCILIFTGLYQYIRLYRARLRAKRSSLIWQAGGWWRDLHRWIAIGASVFVTWIALTGLVISIDNFGAFARHIGQGPPPKSATRVNGFSGDLSAPIAPSEIPNMTNVTLEAFHRLMPGTGIKVLRLRYFAAYAQGVVVANNPDTSQLVFNADTGKRMSMSEPGYPDLGFPLGWEWHQRVKQLHRGDYFGMPGRWMCTIGALALLYLSVSGVVMYLQMLARRRSQGRTGLIWK